jgi:hypothetical protein
MSDILVFNTIHNLQRDICMMFVLRVGTHLCGIITQKNKITRRKEYSHPKSNRVKAWNTFDIMGLEIVSLKDVIMRHTLWIAFEPSKHFRRMRCLENSNRETVSTTQRQMCGSAYCKLLIFHLSIRSLHHAQEMYALCEGHVCLNACYTSETTERISIKFGTDGSPYWNFPRKFNV